MEGGFDDLGEEVLGGVLLKFETGADGAGRIEHDADAEGEIGLLGEGDDRGGRTAVVEQAKVALLQVGDVVAVLVGDREDEIDEVGANFEGLEGLAGLGGGCLAGSGLGGRGLGWRCLGWRGLGWRLGRGGRGRLLGSRAGFCLFSPRAPVRGALGAAFLRAARFTFLRSSLSVIALGVCHGVVFFLNFGKI